MAAEQKWSSQTRGEEKNLIISKPSKRRFPFLVYNSRQFHSQKLRVSHDAIY